jgi:hypothetical protein
MNVSTYNSNESAFKRAVHLGSESCPLDEFCKRHAQQLSLAKAAFEVFDSAAVKIEQPSPGGLMLELSLEDCTDGDHETSAAAKVAEVDRAIDYTRIIRRFLSLLASWFPGFSWVPGFSSVTGSGSSWLLLLAPSGASWLLLPSPVLDPPGSLPLAPDLLVKSRSISKFLGIAWSSEGSSNTLLRVP